MVTFFDYPEQEGVVRQDDPPFLAHWDEGRWRRLLAFTEHRRFRAGDLLVRYGDEDSSMFIVTLGQVEVLLPSRGPRGWRVAGWVEPGSVVGEQAFLDGRPRSATLRAGSDGELLSLSRDAYDRFALREPDLAREIVLDLARAVSLRLRQANDIISGQIP